MGKSGAVELDEIVKVLVSLGIDGAMAREELEAVSGREALAEEAAALAVESEAGLFLPLDAELDSALFELVDALCQAGAPISLGQVPGAAAVVLDEPAGVFEVRFGEGSGVLALVAAIGGLLPPTHVVLHARSYDAGAGVALVVLERASHRWLCAALGADALDAVLTTCVDATGVSVVRTEPARLLSPDFSQRFQAHAPDPSEGPGVDDVWARVSQYDARIPWPVGAKRPPGDDLYELTAALAHEPWSRALASGDAASLANVLYRFALITSVGGHWDLLAARHNPGLSAQGVLGFGQLAWSWFILDAMGATGDADAVARLLDNAWVRAQERSPLHARQSAWFDLGVRMRGGGHAPALLRLRELLPLLTREGFHEPANLTHALGLHTEPRGDQLTHHPLFYAWPAPIYALARRSSALELLPRRDPFLSRPVRIDMVDMTHPMVAWAKLQLGRIATMDSASLPALLDPLPVVIDVTITHVTDTEVRGRTLLAARDDVEHEVVAPRDGQAMTVGQVWLLEVNTTGKGRATRRHDDLGEVEFQIGIPSGTWLRQVSDADR